MSAKGTEGISCGNAGISLGSVGIEGIVSDEGWVIVCVRFCLCYSYFRDA